MVDPDLAVAALGQIKVPCPSTEMCSVSQAGSYLRLIDSCITQLKAQGPSRTCNESKEEEEEEEDLAPLAPLLQGYLALKKLPPPPRTTIGP